MKSIVVSLVTVVVLACGYVRPRLVLAESATKHYDEPFRPQFHFTPQRNWMNDPNGPIHYEGEYHLFFQHNPFGDGWGHMSWGHAVSNDLVHWHESQIALKEEAGAMIFSGSTVVDWQNTSGLCSSHSSSHSCLVAIYTSATAQSQSQSIAYSNDKGRTWTKYSGNPVLDLNLHDFRDPKVFWHKATHKWIMAVSMATEHKIRFFSSSDLKHWTALSDFGPAGAVGGVWECPDLFELPIEGEPGKTRWVLSVNLNPGGISGGSGNQYFVGRFDGTKFISENDPRQTLWADYGADFYASTSFADTRPGDHRRIWIAWLDNWNYAEKLPTKPWRGTQSIPRVLTLRRIDSGLRLVQKSIEELHVLRAQRVLIQASDLEDANRQLGERRIATDTMEIIADVDAGNASTVGLRIGNEGHDETIVGADISGSTVFVDRTQNTGALLPSNFSRVHSGPLPLDDRKHLTFHIFVDRSSVEVFFQRGATVISDQIFPTGHLQNLKLYSTGGKAGRINLEVWRLKSVWR